MSSVPFPAGGWQSPDAWDLTSSGEGAQFEPPPPTIPGPNAPPPDWSYNREQPPQPAPTPDLSQLQVLDLASGQGYIRGIPFSLGPGELAYVRQLCARSLLNALTEWADEPLAVYEESETMEMQEPNTAGQETLPEVPNPPSQSPVPPPAIGTLHMVLPDSTTAPAPVRPVQGEKS